jgi:hypothetical protein
MQNDMLENRAFFSAKVRSVTRAFFKTNVRILQAVFNTEPCVSVVDML